MIIVLIFYIYRNLPKAESLYRLAINNGERLESSVKDLATILHQQGKTDEACAFLEENKFLFPENISKFDNLINNLKKQVVPSGNFLNRKLILFNVPTNFNEKTIKELFSKDQRILDVDFKTDKDINKILSSYKAPTDGTPIDTLPTITIPRVAILNFASNSGARKTLETLKDQTTYQFYWMNVNFTLIGKAIPYQKPVRDEFGNVVAKTTTLESNSNVINNTNDFLPLAKSTTIQVSNTNK